MVYNTELRGFWTLSVFPYRKNQRTQRFRSWICFRSQVMGETPTPLGHLERAEELTTITGIQFPKRS
jgi:hypothetical protein